jgi:hypothetical protein
LSFAKFVEARCDLNSPQVVHLISDRGLRRVGLKSRAYL